MSKNIFDKPNNRSIRPVMINLNESHNKNKIIIKSNKSTQFINNQNEFRSSDAKWDECKQSDISSIENTSNSIITTIMTPSCINNYSETTSEENHIPDDCECKVCVSHEISCEVPLVIEQCLMKKKFVANLQKIIENLTLFIASLIVETHNNKITIAIHMKLKKLYEMYNKKFHLTDPIFFSFNEAMRVYGKYVTEIQNYGRDSDVIATLNKINHNQNEILFIILSQKKNMSCNFNRV